MKLSPMELIVGRWFGTPTITMMLEFRYDTYNIYTNVDIKHLTHYCPVLLLGNGCLGAYCA